jgi:hypothetical protein
VALVDGSLSGLKLGGAASAPRAVVDFPLPGLQAVPARKAALAVMQRTQRRKRAYRSE